MSSSFIHLRTHSSYSLAEGAAHIDRLAKLCTLNAFPALAVTDSNNLFGALEASETFSAQGIQHITGIELKVAVTGDACHTKHGQLPSVVLLAQNAAGYLRLMALSSEAFLTPIDGTEVGVPWAKLLEQTEGLICLTGGPNGPIDLLVTNGREADAETHFAALAAAFPNRLYAEIQRHAKFEEAGIDGRYTAEPFIIRFAYAHDLPLVATNNILFAERSDHAAHDALLCIAEGRYISETDRRRASEEQYFKSADEMAALFHDLPEAISSSVEIAHRCAFRPRTAAPILPSFAGDLDAEKTALKEEAEEGLRMRLAVIELSAPEQTYWDRLEMELGVINKMGFPGYFLIVSDFIKWSKAQDIPVGPGRGSGAGSLVAYALTITDLDPLKFNLLFERFLNPERVSMPDFDIDFCQDRRDEVITYVQKHYGADRVAQIITFGKLQARAVLRDVGRVLQMPYGQVDRLCKMVPNNPANPTTLAEAIAGEPRFKEERENDEMAGELLDTGLRLEGLYRHASTHAAGVVIGDRPLQELVPLYLDPRSDMPATQFNMKWVEPAGLVKFDFLGLKTLTVIQRALQFLSEGGIEVDIDRIPLTDSLTYKMLGRGDAIGVFQLESAGMRATLRGLNADCLEDIIALVSLYRPGPMDNIPTYIERKAGREKPDYLHPLLEDLLRETYGVIIYQEQVMQIAQILSGYSLGEADLLRRAMGKKKKEEMDKQKIRFVDGARDNSVDPKQAEVIFELVAKFAGYGFNKSHAAAYAWISYQTAFLKANHSAAFLAACMSLDAGLTDKLAVFVAEAKRCEVVVEPPCVNRSEADFSVVGNTIFYALGAIKNVSAEAMRCIVEARTQGGVFADIYAFCERVDLRKVGRRSVEQLARAGAFDVIHPNRAQLIQHSNFLMRYSTTVHEERGSSQGGLFGAANQTALARPVMPEGAAVSGAKQLDEERAALGFYLSGHPLDDYLEILNAREVMRYADVADDVKGEKVAVQMAGVVRDINRRRSKSGKPFAWLGLSDASGDYELTVFSEVLAKSEELFVPGARLLLAVTAEDRDGGLRLTAESVQRLDEVRNPDAEGGLRLVIDDVSAIAKLRHQFDALPPANAGCGAAMVLVLPAKAAGCEVEIVISTPVEPTAATRGTLKTIPGIADVQAISAPDRTLALPGVRAAMI